MSVFVLDRRKKPLMPCTEKRARLLLSRGRARVHRIHPFTIRLVDRSADESAIQPLQLKIAPAFKSSGLALCRDDGEAVRAIFLLEVVHRSRSIRLALQTRAQLRRSRRGRKTRYRPMRRANRANFRDWNPPSFRSIVQNVLTWAGRLSKLAPVRGIVLEDRPYDVSKVTDEWGYLKVGSAAHHEMKAYLTAKWNAACAYCGGSDDLGFDHLVPLSGGGATNHRNLVFSCRECNLEKATQEVSDFLRDYPEKLSSFRQHSRLPPLFAAHDKYIRSRLGTGLARGAIPVSGFSGGLTELARDLNRLPFSKPVLAACVGAAGPVLLQSRKVLVAQASGRGRRCRTLYDKHGFARAYMTRKKILFGFRTGDIVRARTTRARNPGSHFGRIAVRADGKFRLESAGCAPRIVIHKNCVLAQHADGYRYQIGSIYDAAPAKAARSVRQQPTSDDAPSPQ